jgi:hypothetical protein
LLKDGTTGAGPPAGGIRYREPGREHRVRQADTREAIWLRKGRITLIFAALAVALGYKLNPDSVQPVTLVVFFFSIFGGLWFPLSGALGRFGEFTPTDQIVKITTNVISGGSVALINVIGIVVRFAIFVGLATFAVRSTAETL